MNCPSVSSSPVRAVITGTGSYLPERVLSNDALSKMVDTSDDWIFPRTGIRSRHIAAPGEAVSDMAAAAAKEALANAGVAPEEVDLIIVATISPDTHLPATACFVQTKIDAVNATCFDCVAACSGFIFTLDIARQYILSGNKKKVLVIGSEKMSSIVDWQDRATCILFGDGAGAVLLEARTGTDAGILSSYTGSDGSLASLLHMETGGSSIPLTPENISERRHFLQMDGHTTFKHAVRNMASVAEKAITEAGLTPSDITWVVPHQANMRIISAVARGLHLPPDRTINTIEETGNTTAASIPIALNAGVRDGRIKSGDIVVFVAFGAGLTWGATALRWA